MRLLVRRSEAPMQTRRNKTGRQRLRLVCKRTRRPLIRGRVRRADRRRWRLRLTEQHSETAWQRGATKREPVRVFGLSEKRQPEKAHLLLALKLQKDLYKSSSTNLIISRWNRRLSRYCWMYGITNRWSENTCFGRTDTAACIPLTVVGVLECGNGADEPIHRVLVHLSILRVGRTAVVHHVMDEG